MEEKLCVGCEEPVIDKKPPCPLLCMSPKCLAYQNRSRIDPETKPIIWVIGGPGCGKLTQCMKIVSLYGFTHLSTGDLLRDEVNRGNDRSKCLHSIMVRGGLVPNDLVLSLLKEAMEEKAELANGFLIDGYPRERSQGIEFEKTIAPVSMILYFEASAETLTQRLLTRAETSGRSDDNIDVIKLRLQTFMEHNQSVLDQYPEKLCKIQAEGTPDSIFCDVQQALEPLVQRAKEAKEAKNTKTALTDTALEQASATVKSNVASNNPTADS